ncbi:FAD:protein FMN transferase [Paraherbaspirillum soli]|uniref:FAD:protein FMN transferase n=1 Tax=Paraherbaspirillum soli TaxID=631222 RepID=A0ABW0MC20_9BURK
MRRRAQPWLGTLVEVTIADAVGEAGLAQGFNAAFAAIAEVHRLMSFHDAASDVARINRAAVGTAIELHPHTALVVRTALMLQSATAGLFDICCASKLVEWGYLPTQEVAVPPYAIPSYAIPTYFPGRSALTMDGAQCVQKNAPAWIDLGGIAKGYAVDVAIAALQASGIRSACVNAGGDLRAYGEAAYPVAIRNPRSPTEVGLRMELKDAALATSGCYFSQKNRDGRAYSALVNGLDGAAITGSFSASVRAAECMLADALTKVVLASGDPSHTVLQQFGATAFII